MLSPIKENRLLFEDDIEEVMYLCMDTSPLETSVLYYNESRRVVSRWMPYLLRSAKNIADQLESSSLHELVTVVSRSNSIAAHDAMHDLCVELEEHVSNSDVWRNFLSCAETLMHTTTIRNSYTQSYQTFFKVLVADSLQMYSTLIMPAVEVGRLVPNHIRYNNLWPSLSMSKYGLESIVLGTTTL